MSSNDETKDKKKSQGGEIARLESLSRRTGARTPLSSMASSRASSASGSTTGRFMPKTVARRPKEERQTNAPVESNVPSKSSVGRARGGRTASRINRQDNISTTVAAGPLGAPSQMAPKTTSTRTIPMAMSMNAFSDRVKSEPGRPGSSSEESTPGPQFENRIDMSSSKAFPHENLALFPVRLEREETPDSTDESNKTHVASDDILDQEFNKLDMDYMELTKSFFETSKRSSDVEVDEKVHIKQENGEEMVIEQAPVSDSRNEFFFMQLPTTIPKFTVNSSDRKSKVKKEDIVEKEEPDDEVFPQEGQIGTIRRHKSGKLTMRIGDMILDVSKGTDCKFLQDVVAHDMTEQNSYLLGQLTKRVIFTPQLDQIEL